MEIQQFIIECVSFPFYSWKTARNFSVISVLTTFLEFKKYVPWGCNDILRFIPSRTV
jgi:hypothetical protein